MASEIKYRQSVTKSDIVRFVYDSLFKNGWKTTFEYTKYSPRLFYEKPLAIPEVSRIDFAKYTYYCFLLSHDFVEKDEAARYKACGVSIYCSVVLYWLLVQYGVVSEKRLKFCQGYFKYKTRADTPPQSRYRVDMHAWLCYDGSVIDITIWQQQEGFDFLKKGFEIPVIMGKIPAGLSLFGYEEEKSLAKEYARRFAKESELTFSEWINYHKKQADLLFDVRAQETGPS